MSRAKGKPMSETEKKKRAEIADLRRDNNDWQKTVFNRFDNIAALQEAAKKREKIEKLGNISSSKFLEGLQSLTESLRAQIETKMDGWDNSESAVNARINQVKNSFEYFVWTYFPHFTRHPVKSQLHEYLFSYLPQDTNNPKSVLSVTAAPRGEAKSTLCSQLYPLWRIINSQAHYILIVMNSIDQAYPMLEAIKAELEFNPRLKSDFPKIACIGKVWQMGTIVTANSIKVQVAGSCKKLRGLRHGAYRPDLIILDDIENDENVRKAEQREKVHNWLSKTVMPLGAAGEKCDICFIGTVLHYDSVLNRTLNNPSWRARRFQAITRMPDNLSLWDRWEVLINNKQLEQAQSFYEANQLEMNKGAQVSWQARPLLELMKIRATIGHESFDCEYQNDPTAGEEAVFAHCLSYFKPSEVPAHCLYFGAVDPSLGKAGAGRDPSAILVGAYDYKSGVLYCVEAAIKKRLPDRIIEDVIAMQKKYNCQLWAIESVQFQEFLRQELIKRSAQKGCPVPARAVVPHSDKALRIESLQPYLQNKNILLNPDCHTLIAQLRHYPKADHDDGPDALQMLYALAVANHRNTQARAWKLPEPDL